MPALVTSLAHPYWALLGARALKTRTRLQYSQAKVATAVGLSVREYAALESGFIPREIAEALGRMPLTDLDKVLKWEEGRARGYVMKALAAVTDPGRPVVPSSGGTDRSTYPTAAWARLGTAVQQSRRALGMNKAVLGYAIRSSSKSILRLEEGRVYGDPRTAPPGDYNSERYLLKRLALLEMALEWDQGHATALLDGHTAAPAA